MSSRWPAGVISKNPVVPTGPATNGSAPGMWRMDEVAYWVKQGLWPSQQFPDPYFSYVAMLLSTTSLGNANNNLFVDSSGAFNPISRNGNTTQGSMTPYGANWSNYFDGSGDLLSLAGNSAFSIPTSSTPFTFEAWINPFAAGGCIFSEAYTGAGDTIPLSIIMANGTDADTNGRFVTFGFWNGGAWSLTRANTQVPLNTWTHVACVFTGSTSRIYYNGIDVTASSPITSWAMTGDAGDGWYVGQRWDTAGIPYFSGYISNLRFVIGTAVYTSAFTPPTTPLTAISGTVLLTCQSNRFRDASTNNFAITWSGDTRVTDFSPFAPTPPGITYNQSDITNWSGYFDGSGDYLSTPANAAFDFGTGDFTLECWVYRNDSTGTGLFESRGGSAGLLWYIDGTNQYARVYIQATAAHPTSTITVPTNQWVHLAVTRSSGVVYFWMNGQAAGSSSISTSIGSTATLRFGASNDAAQYNGYLSNMRVVKGTAVYTAAFTPPTTNLTAISGTSLLTLQNAAFTDNSTNNFVITPNGNVTVTGNSPFNTTGYWSNYFDGNADFLDPALPSTTLSSSWTFECWFYATATGGVIFDARPNNTNGYYINVGIASSTQLDFYYNSSSNLVTISDGTLNKWIHLAVVKNGSNISVYANGTSIFSATDNNTWLVGASRPRIGANGGFYSAAPGVLTGYVSNFRIVNGTAVYTANFTPPTTPLTAITNTALLTCQASRLIDSSTNNYTIARTGDVSVQSFDPFYTSTVASNGGSMYFDGNGDYLLASPNPVASYSFGTNDFTIECWAYVTSLSVYGGLIDTRPAANASSYAMGLWNTSGNRLDFIFTTSGTIRVTSASTFALNAWNHFAVTRSNGVIRLFINGVLDANSFTFTGAIDSGRAQPLIGAVQDPYYLNGYMSDFRITKGTALYTATFTPPSAPLTPSANTTALINGMNAGIYDATAINDMETVGNAQVTTAVSKYGGSSIAFDGSGDYLAAPNNTELNFGSGDFTFEYWINFNSVSGIQGVIGKRINETIYAPFLMQLSSSRLNLYMSTSGSVWEVNAFATGTLTAGLWYHIAVCRSGTTIYMFVNGNSVGSTVSLSGSLVASTSPLYIGADSGVPSSAATFNGYMDDLRITKGYARYTANFTPPPQAFSGF